MLSKNQLSVIIVLAAAVWAGSLWFLGLPINWEYSKPFATTVSVLSAIFLVFDKWAWKWPLFNEWLVNLSDHIPKILEGYQEGARAFKLPQ